MIGQRVASLIICVVLASLVGSQFALASTPPIQFASATPAADHQAMPCHMGMDDGAATTHGGRSDTGPCPMMKDGFCFAMCAAALPSAPTSAIPIEYVGTHLPVFEARVLVAHVVSPPQRPPKTL